MSNEPRSFQTNTPKANHAAQQGQGVGAREMEAMQDPSRPDGELTAADIPEEDDFTDRSRLGDKDEADRGHGPKTRARSKEIINGGLT